MRKYLIISAILLQVFVLAYIALEREYVVRSGKRVYLRTAPVDPRDLFRGDFMRLDYEIGTIPMSKARNTIQGNTETRGRKVFTALREGRNGLFEVDYVTYEKPATGVFIRGREGYDWRFGGHNKAMKVQYGIESYYVEQGTGKKMEERQGVRNAMQVPLEMEVVIGRNGTAIITGYRWSPLGIGLEIVENAVQQDREGRRSVKIRISLMNASKEPIAIIDLPDMCSFRLEPVVWAQQNRKPSYSRCSGIKPSGENMVLLQPSEKRTFDFDFSEERWKVMEKGIPVEIGLLQFSEMFRIVYEPPPPEDCVGLTSAELVRHGRLSSRAFHGRGDID